MLFAVSDQVWLALIALISSGFGLVNVWMQQRNKGVTETHAKEISSALAENTAITQAAHDMVKEVTRS